MYRSLQASTFTPAVPDPDLLIPYSGLSRFPKLLLFFPRFLHYWSLLLSIAKLVPVPGSSLLGSHATTQLHVQPLINMHIWCFFERCTNLLWPPVWVIFFFLSFVVVLFKLWSDCMLKKCTGLYQWEGFDQQLLHVSHKK